MIQYNIYIFILYNYYYHWQLIIFFLEYAQFWAIARWISQCLSVLRPRRMGCWMQQPFCTNCPEWKSRASPSFWFLFGQIIRETPLRISRILKYLGVSCGKQGRNLRFPEDFPIAQVDVLHPSAWDELWPRLLWRETNRLGMGFTNGVYQVYQVIPHDLV